MNNNIKVSVIMSTYKTPIEYLEESINSILNQTYKNIEFIIICDGDKNNFEYIKEIKDDRIKIIYNEKNIGLPKSLNEGLKLATGKYIARMDSDDISLKERLQKQVDFMEKNENIQICGMYAKNFGNSNKINYLYFIKPEEIEVQLLYKACLIHPTVMFRSSFIIKNNICYDDKFLCAQDYELWARVVNSKNIAVIPEVDLMYRVHDKQISKEKQAMQKNFTNVIIKKYMKKIKIKDNSNVEETLMVLAGKKELNNKNFRGVSATIDEIVRQNGVFNEKILKRILYNRYFHLMLHTGIIAKELVTIFKDKSIFKKIFRVYNFRFLINRIVLEAKYK